MDRRQMFQDELTAATLHAARRAVEQFADEGIYSFALYTSGEYNYVFASASTRVGLAQVAERYLSDARFARAWHDLPTAMAQLKWSPCDSPHHLALADDFIAAGELLDALWQEVEDDPEDDEDYDDEDLDDEYNRLCSFVHGAFAEALREVSSARIFGDEVTFNILMGDQGDDERLENAALLNDEAIVEKLRNDLSDRIDVLP